MVFGVARPLTARYAAQRIHNFIFRFTIQRFNLLLKVTRFNANRKTREKERQLQFLTDCKLKRLKEEDAAEDFHAAFWTDMCTTVRQTLTSDGNALAQGKFLSKQIGVDRVSTEKSWRRVVCGHLHRARNELHRSIFFSRRIFATSGGKYFHFRTSYLRKVLCSQVEH